MKTGIALCVSNIKAGQDALARAMRKIIKPGPFFSFIFLKLIPNDFRNLGYQ